MKALWRSIPGVPASSYRFPWRLTTRFNSTGSNSSSYYGYGEIEEIEDIEDYLRPKGLYPIVIGDLLKKRYRIVHKLGHGAFSTIWLARDEKQSSYVALKVGSGKSSPRETEILAGLRTNHGLARYPGYSMIPQLQDHFTLEGRNGTHYCYTTIPAEVSLAAVIEEQWLNLEVARALIAQLILVVAHIHDQGYVHGDLHLGNTLVRSRSSLDSLSVEQIYDKFGRPFTEKVERRDRKSLPNHVPSHGTRSVILNQLERELSLDEAHLVLSDFGGAFAPSSEIKRGDECCAARAFLPPEAYFEPESHLSFPADIWMLACSIWCILSTEPPFYFIISSSKYVTMRQFDILGPLPAEWWNTWKDHPEFFDEAGRRKAKNLMVPPLRTYFQQKIQEARKEKAVGYFAEQEAEEFIAMIQSMLKYKPEDRATAADIVSSEWMVKWGMPYVKNLAVQ